MVPIKKKNQPLRIWFECKLFTFYVNLIILPSVKTLQLASFVEFSVLWQWIVYKRQQKIKQLLLCSSLKTL